MKTVPFKIFLPIIFILFWISTPVLAAGEPMIDWTKSGSVSVTLKDGNTAVSGAEITLYQVAVVESKEEKLNFVYTVVFKGFGGSPENLADTAAIQCLADYAVKNSLSGKSFNTNENGYVCFQNLPLGLYLAVQTGSVQGYSDCTPFLVSIPTIEAD